MHCMKWYLKQKKNGILLSALSVAILFFTFYLYSLPVEAVAYPCILCTLIWCFYYCIDFLKFKKKHAQLHGLMKDLEHIGKVMPPPNTLLEQDYQRIIVLLQKQQQATVSSLNDIYCDQVDYYTLWMHQIKTPVSSMKLSLQKEDSLLSRKMMSELLRIERYIEMVLIYVRLQSPSNDYLFKEYSVDTIVKQSIRCFATDFIQKKIQLIYEPIEYVVTTDAKWLSFIVEQVLSNALKYTPHGHVHITLSEKKVLCIADSGIGIAPDDLPRIFEKGYTGYIGRIDQKASGIGLYLCKTIAERLGHPIWATSILNRGTTIYIDLSQSKIEIE